MLGLHAKPRTIVGVQGLAVWGCGCYSENVGVKNAIRVVTELRVSALLDLIQSRSMTDDILPRSRQNMLMANTVTLVGSQRGDG